MGAQRPPVYASFYAFFTQTAADYLNFLRINLWDEGPADLILYQKALKQNRALRFGGSKEAEIKVMNYLKKMFEL